MNTQLQSEYTRIRAQTCGLIEQLSAEDCCVQSMPDASPAKWHLAHTTWFFETFILSDFYADYRPANPEYKVLFNSYYNTVGAQHPRPSRGMLTRPSLQELRIYRDQVDDAVARLLATTESPQLDALFAVGLHHEQQHQELLLMDVKHLLSVNPLAPAYDDTLAWTPHASVASLDWRRFSGGAVTIGADDNGFSFDNEKPQHRTLLADFALAQRLITNGEFRQFIEDGGYEKATLWLSDGWSWIQRHQCDAPAYWRRADQGWQEFTLGGLRELDDNRPVVHISYYEADAFARWAGARLPRECEWELAAREMPINGNLLDAGALHPVASNDAGLSQIFGDVWEWTASAYAAYPGYHAAPGALGEYNGKFMNNQYVLRGGCCVTPLDHIRASYRNFFYPHNRWQFAGMRLALDGHGTTQP